MARSFLSSRQALVLLALVMVLWGVNWPVMKVGLAEMPPFRFAFARVLLGGLSLFAIAAWVGGLRLPRRRDLPLLLSIGLLQVTAPLALIHVALQYVDAGRSAILAYTVPLWVTPLALVFLGERPDRRKWLGLLLGLGGVAVMFAPGALDLGDRDALIGNGLLLLAAMCWAAAIVHVRGHDWDATPLELLPWQMVPAAVVLGVLSLALEGGRPQEFSASLIAVLAYNGPITSAFCLWAYVSVAKALPATSTALGSLGVPVAGLLSSAAFLGEPLGPEKIAGLVLIGAGIATLARDGSPGR